jgi:hypothetical protein
MEIFNEICFMALTINFYLFTDYLSSPYSKWNAGWSAIAIIAFNIVVNILCIFGYTVKGFCNLVKNIKKRFIKKNKYEAKAQM